MGPWSSLDKTSGFGLRVGGRNQKIEGSNPSGPATKSNGAPAPQELKKITSKFILWYNWGDLRSDILLVFFQV